MRCVRCNSPRLVKFIDGFGKERIFCKDCWNSIPIKNEVGLDQKRLPEFNTQLNYRLNVR